MENVKSCPFCGGTNLRLPNKCGLNVQKWWCLKVQCESCGSEGPTVHLKQYKTDGELYAHGSRRPKSAAGQARWDGAVDAAIEKAIVLWNAGR